MPQQPHTEEDVLELIMAEERQRRELGYPEHVIHEAGAEIREAFAKEWEFVGALGGLRWTQEDGWQ